MAPPTPGGRDGAPSPDAPTDEPSGRAATAVDVEGRALGPVVAVFEDDHTGRPELALLALPDGERLVPLAGSRTEGPRLRLAVSAASVEASPLAADVEHVGPDDVLDVYRRHGLSPADDTADGAAPGSAG